MDKTLVDALHTLGIDPITAAVLVLVIFVAAPSAAWLWKQHIERKKPQDADLREYSKRQSKGLAAAYAKLFANEEAKDANGPVFLAIVKAADDALMKPFQEYRNMLDAATRAKIMVVHNALAQHYQASEQAIGRFKARATDFHILVENARAALREQTLLARFWSACQRRLRRQSPGVTVKRIRARTQHAVVVNYMTIDPQNPMDVWNEDILSSKSVAELLESGEIEIVDAALLR